MGCRIPQNTSTIPMDFPLIAADHISPLYGKAGSVVVAIRKLGGQWQAPAGAITEKAIGAPGAPTTGSASNTGGHLAASTQYFYKITATNILGETLPSAETSYTTPAGTATNQITLSWSAVIGATGYKVYRFISSGGELLLATLGNVLTYADTSATTPSGAIPTQDTTSGGFYSVAPNATDSNTAGPIVFIAKDAASDYTLDTFEVVGFNPLLPDLGLNAAAVPAAPTPGTWGSAMSYADSKIGRRFTAQGGTNNTIQLDGGASSVDNAFKDHFIKLLLGTGAGQFATCVSYSGSTKIAVITRPGTGNWTTNPDNTTYASIEPFPMVDLQPVQTAIVPADVQTIKTQTVTCAAPVTVGPNVGTAQPLAFTGTGGSALVKADAVDFGGQAASAFDGIAPAVSGTTVTLDSTRDGRAYLDNTGNIIQIGGSFGRVASSNTSTFVQTLDGSGWQGAGMPAAGGYTVWTKGASAAPDPWATTIPGSYGNGTAGKILGTNLDVAVSSRSTYAGGAVASVTGNVGGNVAGSVGSVVGLGVVALDGGTVLASPSPTPTTFSATMSAPTGAYNGMVVLFQQAGKPMVARTILTNTNTSGRNDFVLAPSPAPPLPAAPSTNDAFLIG